MRRNAKQERNVKNEKRASERFRRNCKKELQEANKAFRAFASTHEGYAVVLEEFEELKERFDQTEEILKTCGY